MIKTRLSWQKLLSPRRRKDGARKKPGNRMPTRYKEAQLLTDMISGMTDKFAVDLFSELRRYAT